MSFDDGLMLGLMLGGDGGGGGDEEWFPPDDWLPVPEPDEWEIYYLIQVNNSSNNVSLRFAEPGSRAQGFGTLIVDWGDGNTNTYEEFYSLSDVKHSYSDEGQFIIKITTDKKNCLSGGLNTANNIDILICKSGSNIVYAVGNSYDPGFSWKNTAGISKLHYLKHYGESTLFSRMFSQCYYLKKVEMVNHPITVVPDQCFANCYTLQNIDLSEVTEVQSYGFGYMYGTMLKKISMPKCVTLGNSAFVYNYGLEEINVPKCDTVGSSAFSQCYTLKKAVFAENCTYGAYCFIQCYNLYPHPDGSAY